MTATFTLQCWGCDKTVTRPYLDLQDMAKRSEELKAQGWRVRTFGPGASPWFCSDECEKYSYNAQEAERLWKNKDQHAGVFWVLVSAIIVMALIISAVSIGLQF